MSIAIDIEFYGLDMQNITLKDISFAMLHRTLESVCLARYITECELGTYTIWITEQIFKAAKH